MTFIFIPPHHVLGYLLDPLNEAVLEIIHQAGQIARELDLPLTGGSDFHGDPAHARTPGAVTLPAAEFARLRDACPHAFR